VQVKRVGTALSVTTLLAIGIATLTPTSGGATSGSFWCIACGDLGALDVAANIVLFIPLGFALVLAIGRRGRAVAACIITTLLIELLQYRLVRGRDAALSDVLSNSLGGWLGAELALRWRMLLHPRRSEAPWLALTATTLLAGVLSLTSVALTPASVPRALWVQWLPERPGFARFTGRLLAFDVDGIDLPLGFPNPKLQVDAHLRAPTWSATATISPMGLRPARSIIVRVAEEFTVLVSVEQTGNDLTCQQKTRASDYGFRSPKVALRGGLQSAEADDDGASSGEPVQLTCARHERALVAAVTRGGHRSEYSLRLSPSLGWLVLSPFDVAFDDRYRIMSVAWLAVLAFPSGYWAGWARQRRDGSSRVGRLGAWGTQAAVVMALTIGFLIVPLVAHTAVAAWWEWGAAAGAVLAGAVSARLAARWWAD